jgi:Fur family transcriptional regulator, ferric uptake regulator
MSDVANQVKHFKDVLRADGVRITRQRSAILAVLAKASDHPDANELHRRAQEIDPAVSLATVYRTLSVLEKQGVVHRHSFAETSARFETADVPHHDHIIDTDTGGIIEFRSAEIERMQEEIAEKYGYEILHHRLELYCRKKIKKTS